MPTINNASNTFSYNQAFISSPVSQQQPVHAVRITRGSHNNFQRVHSPNAKSQALIDMRNPGKMDTRLEKTLPTEKHSSKFVNNSARSKLNAANDHDSSSITSSISDLTPHSTKQDKKPTSSEKQLKQTSALTSYLLKKLKNGTINIDEFVFTLKLHKKLQDNSSVKNTIADTSFHKLLSSSSVIYDITTSITTAESSKKTDNKTPIDTTLAFNTETTREQSSFEVLPTLQALTNNPNNTTPLAQTTAIHRDQKVDQNSQPTITISKANTPKQTLLSKLLRGSKIKNPLTMINRFLKDKSGAFTTSNKTYQTSSTWSKSDTSKTNSKPAYDFNTVTVKDMDQSFHPYK